MPLAISLAGCLSFGSHPINRQHQRASGHRLAIADRPITSTSQRRLANSLANIKGASMQGSSRSNGSRAVVFSTPSTSLLSLTSCSTGRLPASLAAAC